MFKTALILLILSFNHLTLAQLQQQPNLLTIGHDMQNFRISESQPVDEIVYTLKAVDRFNENRRFSYHMTGEYFSVNEQTGDVRLVKPLDREKNSTLVVFINVHEPDSKNDSPVESRRRTIIIEDIDDSYPVFMAHRSSVVNNPLASQYVYQVDVSELQEVNKIILADIQVTDADEAANAEMSFECRPKQSTNQACDVFGVDYRRVGSGRYLVSIRTKSALDFERVDLYKLHLLARGRRPSPLKGVPLETEAVINIQVLNVQDENPVFLNAPYSLTMHEGLPESTHLLKLIVQDGDASPRDLSVIVAPGPFSDYFQVIKDREANNLWNLETKNVLDRENAAISLANNMFNISLLAAELDENGKPVASEAELSNVLNATSNSRGTLRRENVVVIVLDTPDTPPVFVKASSGQPIVDDLIVFNISESLVSGASIPQLDLAVLDLDQGINSRFSLKMIDSPSGPAASKAFKLESELVYGKSEVVFELLNSSLIDYEIPAFRTYRFQLLASKKVDSIVEQLENKLEIQINVQDANDNSPQFDRDQYVFELLEGSPPNTPVGMIRAIDLDSGEFGHVNYMLFGLGSRKFNLQRDGKILVNDCGVPQCIDFETQPVFSFTYQARDGGGRSSNVSVIIQVQDVNDHKPQFSESVYKRELITDNLSSKQNYISPQLIVKAKDGDGPRGAKSNITYTIISSNLTNLDVERESGLVYLSGPLDLSKLISTVQSERGSRTGAQQKIIFQAEVMAEDKGKPSLSSSAKILLSVKSNKDGAPQFKQDIYQSFVRENQPINKPFYQVQAVDPDDKDSQLRYSIGYDLNDLVVINSITGELSFKTKLDYDDFLGVPYNISVVATDNSKPYPLKATAVVSILVQDVNDKWPKFQEGEYREVLIQGRSKIGDLVLQVKALDPDKNAQLNYSIVANQMSIHDRNGQQFTLADIENSSVGYLAEMSKSERAQLVANLKKLFAINKSSGSIELRAEPDYLFAASISVLVKVQDLNQEVFSPSGEIQQDSVNCTFILQTPVDKNPVFASPWSIVRRHYNISIQEELPVGTNIFSLLANDPSSKSRIDVFEKVYESDPRDFFKVDRSGLVLINRRVDFEELPAPKRFSVSVKALTNDVYQSTAVINIQVLDLNDNAPQFRNQNYSVSVSEAVVYPQEILTLKAEDKDSGEYGKVYYSLAGNSADKFSIDAKEGIIRVKKAARLDRESEQTHQLVVVASDCNETRLNSFDTLHDGSQKSEVSGCKKSSVLVDIHLMDENDNDPVFANANRRGEIEALTTETVSTGVVIAQVSARDADEAANGQVSYEIVRADDSISRLLKIDRDGYISVVESLSGMGRLEPYRVSIRAFDHGKVSRESFVSLLLTINDVVANDGVPRFIKPRMDEVVSISESSGPGTFVYQVQAVDPDEESSGKLMYKFIQHSDLFEIDPFTGIIKTQNRANFHLDREQTPNNTLVIVAQDLGSPPKQAHQVLTVKISDVNDNEPYFERNFDDPPIVLYVEEETAKDTLIGSIRAIDRDVGQNALIGYEIIEGNQEGLFRLDYETDLNSSDSAENGCKIYSTSKLDRELRESYMLTIRASSVNKLRNHFSLQFKDPLGSRNPFNQYNASDLTKIRVNIKLLDINDNRPVFVEQSVRTVVDSSAEIYSQLMVFKAVDADSSSSDIHYSIIEANYFSDSKLSSADSSSSKATRQALVEASSARNVFDIDARSGVLRNSASLRPYIDGYFEVYVKADSSFQSGLEMDEGLSSARREAGEGSCKATSQAVDPMNSSSVIAPFAHLESCSVAVAKGVVFVSHQRETFRFVFNKTKLKDRFDEFKSRMEVALEELMFEPGQVQASTDGSGKSLEMPRAEKVYLNTFNTDFHERDDGSPDFSTLTSCSQLVKFDDRLKEDASSVSSNTLVPNQVINYEQVLNLLKTLNATQMRNHKSTLFSQFGLVNVEKCSPDRTMYRMSLSERIALYFAAIIALLSILLAFIVNNMRKNYEKNLKLLQRSKYQYLGQYSTLPQPAHHLSLANLQSGNFMAPTYGSSLNLDAYYGASQTHHDTWQL